MYIFLRQKIINVRKLNYKIYQYVNPLLSKQNVHVSRSSRRRATRC